MSMNDSLRRKLLESATTPFSSAVNRDGADVPARSPSVRIAFPLLISHPSWPVSHGVSRNTVSRRTPQEAAGAMWAEPSTTAT